MDEDSSLYPTAARPSRRPKEPRKMVLGDFFRESLMVLKEILRRVRAPFSFGKAGFGSGLSPHPAERGVCHRQTGGDTMQASTGRETVLGAIRAVCETDPGATAAVFPAQPAIGLTEAVTFSREGLDREARALAVKLREVAEGPVLLLMQPGPDYLKGFLATVYAGLPAAPVYPPNPADVRRDFIRLGAILAKLPDATLLTEPGLLEPLRELFAERLPDVRPERLVDTSVPAGAEDDWRAPAVRPEEPLFIQFTSGSTGTPRGVLVSHRNLLANVRAITDRFGLDTSSTGALWLPPYHDMGLVGGVLTPLVSGFPIHLLSPLSFVSDPMGWLRLVSETGATHTGAPNFGYALATRRARDEDVAALDLSRLQVAFSGAEPVDASTLRAFAERFAPAGLSPDVFLPCYGLAESTLIVSGGRPGAGLRTHRLDPEALALGRAEPARPGAPATELVSSGPVVAGTEVRIADPVTGAAAGPGEIGEVFVASDSVAEGYFEDPEETARTFGATLAGSSRSWMRTGDLGFLGADGDLVPVARIKDVIVVRGRNLHPQDIERTVQDTDPGIRKGCVAAAGVPGPDGGEEILVVAELRPEAADDEAQARRIAREVRAAVAREHSAPVRGIHLIRPSTLPKTSSGKVQRSAARAAHLDGSLATVLCDTADTAAPTGAPLPAGPAAGGSDDLVVNLAATVIRHFVGHGGTTGALDSLGAARLAGEASQIFKVALPVTDILAGVDAEALAALIRTAAPLGGPAAATGSAGLAELPATARQETLCLLQELDPAAPGLALGIAFALPATADPQRVALALTALVARHPALRTRLVRRGEHWSRLVDPADTAAGAPWGRYCTLTRLGGIGERDLEEALAERCRRVPDLAEGPLFQAEVVLADGHGAHLVITVHHAVADLWSIGVLAAELAHLLAAGDPEAGALTLPPAPEVSCDVPDDRRLERAWNFWQGLLTDGCGPLQLPSADGPAQNVPAGRARQASHAPLTLDARRTAALTALAKECGVTLYAVLLAVQSLTLSRLTGTDRVPVAVPLHGRGSATHRAVDYLVSTVTLPMETATGTVRDLVGRAADALRGALAHRTVGYPELVALSAARGGPDVPAPDAALLLQQDTPGAPRGVGAGLLGGGVRLGDVELGVAVVPPSIGPFGLTTLLTETDGTLTGRVEVDPSRHADWLAGRFADAFLAIADSVAAGAGLPLAEASAVGAEQAERLRGWSRSPVPEDGEGTLHDLVLSAAARHPRRTAVVAGDGSLSYGELAHRSAVVAAALAAEGAGPGCTVGVLMQRGRDLPAVLLGVLRSGAAYLPLDAATPPARLAAVVEDAGCRHVLVGDVPVERGQFFPVRTLDVDAVLAAGPAEPVPPRPLTTPDDPAYLLFTSGSTGRPKGVVIPHRGPVNLIRWAGREFGTDALARTLAVTPTTFDLSVFELFTPLAHGCEVRLLDGVLDLVDSPAHAADATLLNTVPSAVASLLEQDALPAGLSVVNVAGEPLTAELVHSVHRRLPGVRMVNLYGPSETTTYSTYAELGPDTSGAVPIGRPVGGTTLSVVDASLRPLPQGATGELLIGGAGVAVGYAGRPGMTAARFLPDPEHPGRRLYRTGDLVRWRADGLLEFLGRSDHQVKVRGFRIELGDVERALTGLDAVREAVVVALGQGTDRRLAAYLVPERPLEGDPGSWLRGVRRRLGHELPGYMVPGEFAVLDELPRNRHGKLDRGRLASTATVPLVTGSRIAPRNDSERRVAACWAQALPVPEIGVTDEFLDVGGHSLMLTTIAHLIAREFSVQVPLTALRTHTTVAEQARYLDELTSAAPPHAAGPRSVRRLDRSRYTAAGNGRTT
uniref:Putative non-ribosomal peptide synthetase n=2 Tax=Streptomyces TaxID=1883 RepID=B0CN25_STRLA|nr:putative non-ribosomal peptide synthetase [Streptomyces lavendulae]